VTKSAPDSAPMRRWVGFRVWSGRLYANDGPRFLTFDANGIRITVGLGALRRWVLRHPEGTGRALWSTSWHEIIGAEYDHRRIRVLRTHGTVLVFLPARSSSVPDIAGELRGHGVRVEQVDRVGSSLT
jgi:hypothetical protein